MLYVDVDLTDVRCLYDCQRSEYLYSNDGQWDINALRRRGVADGLQDRSRQACVALLACAVSPKGFFEKDLNSFKAALKAKNKALQNVGHYQQGVEFPHHLLPVYRPGDVVKGWVVIDLSKRLDAKQLTVSLKGGAWTLISKSMGMKGNDDRAGSEKYVDRQKSLWSSNRSHNAHDGPLEPGQHRLHFHFTLPADARASVPPLVFGPRRPRDYAYIVYRLKATVDKGCCCKCGNVVASRGIWVKKDLDIARLPDFLSPAYVEEVMSTGAFGQNGRITCRVSMAKKAFVPGETISLSLEIGNGDKTPIDGVMACLVIGGKYRTGTCWYDKKRPLGDMHSVVVSGHPVSADSVSAQRIDLPMRFFLIDDNLIPAGDLSDCSLIDVQYEVMVKLVRKGMNMNMVVRVPVTVGTHNSSSCS